MLAIFDENGDTVAVIALIVTSQEIYVLLNFATKKQHLEVYC